MIAERLDDGDDLRDVLGGGNFREIERQVSGVDLGHVEHVVDQLAEVAATREDRGQIFELALVQRTVRLVRENLGEADDRVQGRTELVAHRGQELALGPAGLLGGHLGLEQLPRLVHELLDIALRGGVQARVLQRDDQRQRDGRAERDQHTRPRPGLQPRGLGLRREDPLVDGGHQPVQVLLHFLGARTRLAIGHGERMRAGPAPHEFLLRRDEALIVLERAPRGGELLGLPRALHGSGEPLEILGHPHRPLGPGRRVAGVGQHQRAHLEPDERRDRLAGGRGQADRGNGVGRDLSIDGHEVSDGVEAQEPDDCQHRDDEQRHEEGLRRQRRADEPRSDHARPIPIEHGKPMVSIIVGFVARKTRKTWAISGHSTDA